MPSNLSDAMALLGSLVGDANLALGLQTVAVILVGAGAITFALLTVTRR